MNILSIESASTVCGTALFCDDKMVEIDEITRPRIHGERLPVIIDNILKKYQVGVADLDGIAVSEGPGSYTGLRIGMSLAKGLAVSEGIPIIPVPTLEAMSRGISREGVYWILLHSHKNVVFAQRFNSGCPEFYECVILENDCVPSTCFCDEFYGDWYCTEDCGGGTCIAQLNGDVNYDGILNVSDIIIIVNMILMNLDTDLIADMNDDDNVDIIDIVTIVNLILNN